jgi:hypothetical protein
MVTARGNARNRKAPATRRGRLAATGVECYTLLSEGSTWGRAAAGAEAPLLLEGERSAYLRLSL